MLKRTLVAGIFAVFALSCSGNSDNTQKPDQDVQGQQDLQGQDVGTDSGSDAQPSCELQVSLKGKAYLIKHLYVKEPAGKNNALADTLTNMWNKDIEMGRLVILFYVSKYDSSTGEITIQAGTGIKDKDGKYAFVKDPGPNDLVAVVKGCEFDTTQKGSLVLYPDTVTAHIPIVAMDAHGAFTASGDAINSGKLTGGICTSAAKKIDFDPISKEPPYNCQNFFVFMNDMMHMKPNRNDLNGGICEEGTDGYSFKGLFDAVEIKNFKTDIVTVEHSFECSD